MSGIEELIRQASESSGEELWHALRHHHPLIFERALLNRNLTEDMALFVAKSKRSPQEVLGQLASDVRFKRSYKLMLAIVKNPRTPQRVALSLLKHIKLFDLADLSRNSFLPSVTRKRVELMLTERIPALAAGIKSAMSRRVSVSLLVTIMEHSTRRVIDSCLDSPRLTEDKLVRILHMERTRQQLVQAIAEHPKWSTRRPVRYALVRNFYCPMGRAELFIAEMRTQDLRELYHDSGVPESTKPFIYMELVFRGQDATPQGEGQVELEESAADAVSGDEAYGLLKRIDESGQDEPEEDAAPTCTIDEEDYLDGEGLPP